MATAPLSIPSRVLLGPGPSDVAPSVLRALSAPTIGHLDPVFLTVMDEIRSMLRTVFQTENPMTMPMSGTGSAGMETCIVNLIEPGDRVVVAAHGVFGGRMAEVARRAGATVHVVETPWGQAVDLEGMRSAAKSHGADLLGLVHAETSTGVLQDLSDLRGIADEAGALCLVDTVTSLAGVPIGVNQHGLDAVYSGTQKCLSCPPGLSPVTFSARAMERMSRRQKPSQSWYLDLALIGRYWGEERAYHHTAPVNMLFALHEALRLVTEEGLEARFARHRRHAEALWAGLEAMGLELIVRPEDRLPPLTLVRIPGGVDDKRARAHLLSHSGVEIGGGLGAFSGKAWRIGLMGEASTERNIAVCLSGLRAALMDQGVKAADPLPAVVEQLSA